MSELALPVARRTSFSFSLALLLDLAALALVGIGNALLAARANAAPLALGMIAAALILRVVQVRVNIVRIPFHVPWILFVASAWLGVIVSFDADVSLRKFILLMGGVALYYVIATTQTPLAKKLMAWGLLLIGAGIAVFFVTQTDFTREPIKLEILNQIGLLLNRVSPQFGFHTPHANLMAGILLLCVPYALGIAYDAVRHKRWLEVALAGAGALLLTFGLVMTASRGALLALVFLGGVSAYLYLAAQLAKRARVSAGIGIAIAVNLALVIFLLLVAFGGNRLGALTDLFGTVNGVPRPLLYQQVFQLVQEYSFTGAGLDTFSPHFSTYEMLINVPLLPHAHNLYLQVWFEQGLVGIIALAWLIGAYYLFVFQRRGRMNWLAVASIAAVTMMLMHGLVDVLFYFSRVISLMFIPIGLTVCALEPFAPLETSPAQTRRAWMLRGAAVMLVVAMVALLFFLRREQWRAQWTANWGALEQAKIELPQIKYPRPTPPEIRRASDLSDAEKLFRAALAQDEANRVATTRLGVIALDRFEFPQAITYLETAHRSDRNNRAAVKALGYAYVWTNKLNQAETLLKQIPEAHIELNYMQQEWRRRGRLDLEKNAEQVMSRLKP